MSSRATSSEDQPPKRQYQWRCVAGLSRSPADGNATKFQVEKLGPCRRTSSQLFPASRHVLACTFVFVQCIPSRL